MLAENRIPVTHVGSLVRPPELLRYIMATEQAVVVDRNAFDAQLRRSVEEVVARQKAAGIDIVSDGEFGKFRTWSGYVLERLGNIEEQDVADATGAGRDRSLVPEFYAEYFPTQSLPRRGVPIATGPIFYKGQSAIAHDIEVFKEALVAHPNLLGFVPLVAPASAMPRFRLGHYRTDEEFLFGLAEALRVEYRAVIDAGLYLQVDDAFLPYMYDVAFADRPLDEYRRWAAVRVEALNHALTDLPKDRIRYHICWGSFATPHVSDIELRDIVDLVLRVRAGAYCIEMANPAP